MLRLAGAGESAGCWHGWHGAWDAFCALCAGSQGGALPAGQPVTALGYGKTALQEVRGVHPPEMVP